VSNQDSPTWSKDLAASIVVFLVALPLSIGIAVASGAPLRAGLVAAVVGGIVVGLLGGAPLQVSGPAAGLTVMVYGYVEKFGFEATCAVAVAAGVIQVLAGSARIARAAMAISPAVLQAMLAGIGVLITLGQLHVLFGSGPKSSALENLRQLPATLSATDTSALIVGATTLALLFGWNKLLAKRIPVIPGSLVAIAAGTALGALLPSAPPRVEVPPNVLAAFTWPSLGDNSLSDLAVAALALAFVASCESLLCAVATDKLHSGPRARLDRELLAQGAGNIVSGALGGLPITGVIVRSSANIAAGGKTRLSAILHGVWMLVFVAFLAGFLAFIPRAALAALLVHVGINLVKVPEMRKVAKFGEFAVYAVTLLGVVFINLLWGIGIGVALALVLLLRRFSRIEFSKREVGGEIELTLRGALTFLSVPTISARLAEIPAGRQVRLLLDIQQIDHAAIEAIRAWRVGYEAGGGKVIKQPLDELWRELAQGRSSAPAPARSATAS
jgi:carbonic anhydrase